MKDLAGWSIPARTERPSSGIVHDEPNVRIIGFHLQAGQRIPPHRNGSTVIVQVIDGSGRFLGEQEEVTLGPGGTAVYEPRETHSIEAVGGPLRFLAIITPAPG